VEPDSKRGIQSCYMKKEDPPRWAQKFLSWYCKPELLEDLEGDLNEYFARNKKLSGAKYARRIYLIDVIKFIRLYTIKRPSFIDAIIDWFLLGNYLKTSARLIIRDKFFSFINIAGLAVGMSVGLLLIALMHDLLSYDSFHEKADRICRLTETATFQDSPDNSWASSSWYAAKKIRESVSGVEKVLIMRDGFYGDIRTGEKLIPVNGRYSDENFFDVFTFRFIAGNPRSALKDPNTAVLTKSTALKLFGNTDALGKIFKHDSTLYTITGIIEDFPHYSHFKYDILVSLSSLNSYEKKYPMIASWNNIWNNHTYLLLQKKSDRSEIQKALDLMSSQENKKFSNLDIHLYLQPLNEVIFSGEMGNQDGPVVPVKTIWILTILVIVVLFSAAFNYINLSLARGLRRVHEIHARQILGASRKQIIEQFLLESVLIAFISLIFSCLIYTWLKPEFFTLSGNFRDLATLELTPSLLLWFVLFALVMGLISGIIPAVLISGFRSLASRNLSTVSILNKGLNLRRTLVFIQFLLSIAFISSTFIIIKQYKQFLSFDLGFKTDNVLNIHIEDKNPDALISGLEEIPGIGRIAKSMDIMATGNYSTTYAVYKQDSADVYYNQIDENYLEVFRHKFIAGNNFSAHMGSAFKVIVNRQFIKSFNVAGGDPVKSIGEYINLGNKKDLMEIVGVIENFHFGRVDHTIDPFVFIYGTSDFQLLNIFVKSGDFLDIKPKIEKAWNRFDSLHKIYMRFYNEEIKRAYEDYSSLAKTIGLLAILAIFISSSGLLGIMIFSSESRLKEITIRMVLGADLYRTTWLISRVYFLLLLLSSLLTTPIVFYIFEKIVLRDIVYHKTVGLTELFAGPAIVALFTLLIIISVGFRISHNNPTEILKNE
jgi:putative ABC transport system permease protein